jgi:DNA-binding transcriptional ArsR family regulator
MFISKRCGCRSKNGRCCCSNASLSTLAENLTLLSVKSRLEILFHLQDKSHCVCDLIPHTGLSQSLISHHLGDLNSAKLIKSKRAGKYIDYCLTAKGQRFLKALLFMLSTKGGELDYESR